MDPTEIKRSSSRNTSIKLPSIRQTPVVVYKPFEQKLTFICKFCGGKSCKHENYLTHKASAIKGLNSDWVTDDILATQRPSSRIIKEFNITEEFHRHGINAIFNLQEPGEHPYCGDGIHPQSGFSYFPEEFYNHGIYFFNFGWRDMTATSTDVIFKVLKQMSFSLVNGNKIAIHCHAGRGRTGLIIAAWMIYHHNVPAKEAIKHVRSRRKGAIQSRSQADILYQLEKEIKESRIIFHPIPKYKLEDYLFHQRKLLPMSTESQTRYIPNLVLITFERLEILLSSGFCTPLDVALAFGFPNKPGHWKADWSISHEKELKALKEGINAGTFQISDIDDPRLLAQAVLDFFDDFTVPAIKNQFINTIEKKIHNQNQLHRNFRTDIFKELDKKEFLLVECLTKFFSNLANSDHSILNEIKKAVLRVCVSLTLERKTLDILFLKRSIIKEHDADDRVSHLHIFMLKWIENFTHNFTESYIAMKSPLQINPKKLSEKISSRDTLSRHATYTNLVSTKDDNSLAGKISEKSLPEIQLISPRSQNVSSLNQIKGLLSKPTPVENQQNIVRKNYSEDSEGIDSNFSSDFDVRPNFQSERNSPVRDHSESATSHDRAHSFSLSPIKINGRSISQQNRRINFSIGNHRISNVSGAQQDKSNIQKNYDAIFSKNEIIEESHRDDTEQSPKNDQFKRSGNFDKLLSQIDKLPKEKQTIVFEKLVGIRGRKIIRVQEVKGQ